MSGRKVADRPDPEWVATLKEGDLVAVAEWGHEVYSGVVLRVTPTGLVKVAPDAKHYTPVTATAFYGRHRKEWRIGYPAYGSRYLVPVASSPDSEGGA